MESNMNTKQILNIAMQAGEILIKSGAEVYRVEDTVTRICKSYGTKCECIVLLSGIFLSVEDEDGEPVTLVRRIKNHTIDLSRINLVNEFSRSIEACPTITYEEAKQKLNDIENSKRYGFVTQLFMASFTAYVYTVLFRGNIDDATAAFFCGMVVYSIKELVSRMGFFQFFEFFVSGVTAGFAAIISAKLFPGLNIYKIIVGTIIFLVPGVAITNGIKDALHGDIVSSLYRLTEAAFISIAVGSGVGIVLTIGLSWI